MPKFAYRALGENNQVVEGSVQAADANEVIGRIRALGLEPHYLEQIEAVDVPKIAGRVAPAVREAASPFPKALTSEELAVARPRAVPQPRISQTQVSSPHDFDPLKPRIVPQSRVASPRIVPAEEQRHFPKVSAFQGGSDSTAREPSRKSQPMRVSVPLRAPYWGLFLYVAGFLLFVFAFYYFNKAIRLEELSSDLQHRYEATKNDDYLAQKERIDEELASDKSRTNDSQSTNQLLQYGIMPVAGSLFLLGRRLRARSASQVLARDSRPPVIYLRSFQHDSDTGQSHNSFFQRTDEEKLVKKLRKAGPVIAIGEPGEELADSGAARVYVSHDRWQEVAAMMMKAARLVVLRTSTTPGVLWEVQRAFKSLPLERIILFADPLTHFVQTQISGIHRDFAARAAGGRQLHRLHARRPSPDRKPAQLYDAV